MDRKANRVTEALLDLETGRTWRDRGIARVDAAEPDVWKRAADRAIEQLAATGEPFTAEDVRRMVGDPSRPNAFGSRFLAAARSGLVHKVGYRPSSRPHRHTNPIAVWVGAS